MELLRAFFGHLWIFQFPLPLFYSWILKNVMCWCIYMLIFLRNLFYLGVMQKIPHDWCTAQDASQGIILEISRCAKHKHSNWNYKFSTWQITLLYCNKKNNTRNIASGWGNSLKEVKSVKCKVSFYALENVKWMTSEIRCVQRGSGPGFPL